MTNLIEWLEAKIDKCDEMGNSMNREKWVFIQCLKKVRTQQLALTEVVSFKTYGLLTIKLIEMQKYTVLDEEPKEGDYAISLEAPDGEPRKVERFSEENDTLGMRLEPPSWFEWLPLRKHHRKVEFK